MTRNDLLTALTLTPALAVALWFAFEARHGVTILQSLGGHVMHLTRDEKHLVDALKMYAERTGHPKFPFDDLLFTVSMAAELIERLSRERVGERDEARKLDRALRQKDEAMGVLFQRLRDAGVDYSDLIP